MSKSPRPATSGQLDLIKRLYLSRDVSDMPQALQSALHVLCIDDGYTLRLTHGTASDLIDRLKAAPRFTL